MMKMYTTGLAYGTRRNKQKQATMYVAFMMAHHLEPSSPDQYDIMQFIAHLASLNLSLGSINNTLSGAKAWVADAGGDTALFDSRDTARIKRGLTRNLHRPRVQAPSLSPTDLLLVIQFLTPLGPAAYAPIAALTMGYFSFMRQSNLVSSSPNIWNDPHTIRRKDVYPHNLGLLVHINSSKTISSQDAARSLLVPVVPGSVICPVSAWFKAVAHCPAPPSAPAFMSSPSRPLDQRTLTNILRSSLAALQVPLASAYTLHSLRRGGARACHALCVAPAAIKAQGMWELDAVFSYIPRQAPTAAPAALAVFFGRASESAPSLEPSP